MQCIFAKNSGKNCWRFYAADMQAAAYEKMLLIKRLHHAVGNKEFELHYQPQINISDSAVVGFEALLRWNRPGMILYRRRGLFIWPNKADLSEILANGCSGKPANLPAN